MGITIKRALITGITSQDGAYLAKLLISHGYEVFGTYRKLSSTPNFWRLQYLNIYDKIKLISADVSDSESLSQAIRESDPIEVYHLAAQSYVGASFDQPLYTYNTTGLGVIRILDEIRKFNEKIKFYHASSSEMFGIEKSHIKKESTPFHPVSPYAIARVMSYWTVILYRNRYNMHATNGILFNHESPIRGLEFVTRKITNGIAKISLGLENKLELGNLEAKRDWGYAPDYVEGMLRMLQQKKSDDYILATNETHSIKEFVKEACKVAGVPISKIRSAKENFRPFDIQHMRGDYNKAHKKLKWMPKTSFKQLVKIMVEEDISRWQRWLKGEQFPWDVNSQNSPIILKKKKSG